MLNSSDHGLRLDYKVSSMASDVNEACRAWSSPINYGVLLCSWGPQLLLGVTSNAAQQAKVRSVQKLQVAQRSTRLNAYPPSHKFAFEHNRSLQLVSGYWRHSHRIFKRGNVIRKRELS